MSSRVYGSMRRRSSAYMKRTQETGILSSQLKEKSHCCDDASKFVVIVLCCV